MPKKKRKTWGAHYEREKWDKYREVGAMLRAWQRPDKAAQAVSNWNTTSARSRPVQ